MMNNLLSRLKAIDLPDHEASPQIVGKLTRVVGLTLEAVGLKVAVGDRCRIELERGDMEAEVVGFSGKTIYLMPTEKVEGVTPGAAVYPINGVRDFPYGIHLLGRVIDGMGEPIDGLGPLEQGTAVQWRPTRINPMARRPIRQYLDVGIRAINSLLTIGQGQRMGLFAGSGVGKSVLMGMMTRGTTADIVVVGLVGERGREVKEFIDDILGEEGRARSIVVAAPADASPLMRLKGCETTLSIAEYFRDQGYNVLLLLDSLTRYAMAQREIALAVGEPPATKGYPPSVFAKLPALVERAGNGSEGQGSITAFFTVLVEGDDLQDPIADAARAILDGHIVLSRELADSGHYPAIDVEKSISRVMPAVITEEHMIMARTIRQCIALYNQNRELISIGAYQRGSDARIDQALMIKPYIDEFTQQGMKEVVPFAESLDGLRKLSMILIDDAKSKTRPVANQRMMPPPNRQAVAAGGNNAPVAARMSFTPRQNNQPR
ncbi:MAG: flagellar protein export ATPase FliI [Candidatus Anaerobiospirillum pullicola]|uniref:Flagellum-specific ATP synthase n=1 Tax=Candidatus Anaerobiospirillum pullicola TaxID=2838451 RepID=A0A948X1S4_9GAMM|nr:flagellar protein export ATPase FliI [Candidatus Anaerobiospirillum pullicola]